MTVLAAEEVAPAVTARAGTARAGRYRPRHAAPQPLPPPQPTRRSSASSGSSGKSRRRDPWHGTEGFREVKRRTPRASPRNYQPIILAEFLAAVLLVAGTPLATKKNPSGLSPYAGQDMIKLAALTMVYLILALISTGSGTPARLSAWLGGLVLLTVGLNEATNIAQTLDVFSAGTKGAKK